MTDFLVLEILARISNFKIMNYILSLMGLLITKRLSALALVATIVITIPTASTINPIIAQEAEINEIFTVGITLYGVNNATGNVVTFVEANNITTAKVLNATELDLTDGRIDGIVYVTLGFSNVTIPIGEEFKACNMVLRDLSITCDTGYNSPSIRGAYMDLVLQSSGEQ